MKDDKLSNEHDNPRNAADIAESSNTEMKLFTVKRQIEETIDAIEDPLFLMGLKGEIIRCNKAMARYLGKPFEEIIGQTYKNVLNKESDTIERCFLSIQETHYREAAALQTDNRWVNLTLDPMLDEQNKLVGAVCLISDITEPEMAKQALRESESKYRSLFDNMINGFAYHQIIVDGNGKPVDYVFLEVNDAFEKLTGLKREHVVGKRVTEVIPGIEEDPADWIGKYGRVALTGEEMTFENYARLLNRWYSVSAYSPENGYFAAIFEDITERKQAEEALRKAHERTEWLARFPEENPNPVLRVAHDGIVLYRNPASAELSGWACEAGEQLPNCLLPLLERAMALGQEVRQELQLGEQFYDVWVTPFVDENYANIYGRDITERKQMEKLLRKSYDELEIRVRQRTAELEKANKELKAEIAAHERTAADLRLEQFKLLNILESMEDCVCIINSNFDIDYVNPSLEKQFGPVDDKKCYEYFHEHKDVCPGCRNQEIFKGNSLKWEWSSSKTGQTYEIFDTPFLNNDGTISKLEILHDVTPRKKAEEAVKAERQRLYDVMETLPAYVVLLTPDYHVPFANRFFRERFGESQGKRCFEYLFNRTEPCEICETYSVLKTMKPNEWEWKGPDGRNYYVYDFPFTDTDGSTLILEMGIDVTDLKQAERALHESHELFESAFSNIHVLVAQMDRDFNFIRVNKAYARADGREPEYYIGKNHFDLFPHEENEAIFRKVLQTGEPVSFYGKPFEYAEHPGRGVTYWDWNLQPIKDGKGNVESLVLSLIDRTDDYRSRQNLIESESKYRTLVEQAADAIVILDRHLNIIDINPAGCKMSGFSKEELLRLNAKNFLSSADLRAKPLKLDELFSGETIREERRIIRKDGSLIDVEISAQLLDDGRIQAIARDVSERKEQERRNLLTTGLLELFARKPTRKEYLDSVVELIHKWTGCRNVGIRVVTGDRYIPYESYIGFSREFMKLENKLSLDSDVCACIRVISGKSEKQDAVALTGNGTFCVNNSFEFINSLTEKQKARFRGNCIRSGFASIAIIPVRYRGNPLGTIHLADKSPGMAPIRNVEFLESIAAPLIGEAIYKFSTEEELAKHRSHLEELVKIRTEELQKEINERKRAETSLRTAFEESEQRKAEISSLLEGSNAILKHHDFESAARAIFNASKKIIGAEAGYIALSSRDGTRNEVVFLDAGGLSCTVDPSLPMPIRGLRGEVYNSRRIIYENNFAKSKWTKILPDGHAELQNVLMAPMTVEGQVVGLYALSNKPGGFNDNDVRILQGFTELASIALVNKRAEEELKQLANELARSNADLEQFAYVASHDLQAPLKNVEGFVKLFTKRYRGKLDNKADEFIEFIIDGVKNMQMLIKDLLEYSQVDTKGKGFKPVDSSMPLALALANLQSVIEENEGAVTYDENLPKVMADSSQFSRLFQNLIGNALKFKGKRKPRVHVSALRNDNEWVFSVKDNGLGIKPEDAEKIFAVFQRLHGKSEYPGTGIGLAICKKIVERHGGRIWVESKPGKGSTFFFTIPVSE